MLRAFRKSKPEVVSYDEEEKDFPLVFILLIMVAFFICTIFDSAFVGRPERKMPTFKPKRQDRPQ